MKNLLWTAAIAPLLLAAACGGDDEAPADIRAEILENGQAKARLTISIAQHKDYGDYLVDGDGAALYVFTADTRSKMGRAGVACAGLCLDNWPLALTESEPAAMDGVNEKLIGTQRHDGGTIVTYDGWPLYYFAHDNGEVTGHEIESFGGRWLLARPGGVKAGAEG